MRAIPDARFNEVFAAHPGWVLGELRGVNGQYHEHDLTVRARPDAPRPATARPGTSGTQSLAQLHCAQPTPPDSRHHTYSTPPTTPDHSGLNS